MNSNKLVPYYSNTTAFNFRLIKLNLKMASWICRSCRAVLMRSISWKTHLPSSQLPHYSTDRYGSSLHSKEAQQALVHHTYGKLMDVARRSMQEEPRERFAEALQSYMKQEKYRRGHVKFITFALHQLEEFGL